MERTLAPTELMTLLAGTDRPLLLDVRRRPAFEADPSTLPEAGWRDPQAVEIWAAELPRDRPVIVYCVHGHEVSNRVVDRLRELGFDAALIEGGIEAWKAAGGKVSERPAH